MGTVKQDLEKCQGLQVLQRDGWGDTPPRAAQVLEGAPTPVLRVGAWKGLRTDGSWGDVWGA